MALIGSINPDTQEEKQGEQLAVSGLLGSVQYAGPSLDSDSFWFGGHTDIRIKGQRAMRKETQQQVVVLYIKQCERAGYLLTGKKSVSVNSRSYILNYIH